MLNLENCFLSTKFARLSVFQAHMTLCVKHKVARMLQPVTTSPHHKLQGEEIMGGEGDIKVLNQRGGGM